MANPNTAPPPDNLLERERAPPARPLPLVFPSYVPPPSKSEPLSAQRMSRLRQATLRLKPLDTNDELFKLLNISLQTEVPLLSFIRPGQFVERPFLFDSDLTSMLKELDFNNEDAFREVLRLSPLEGHTKPKLAYSRAFFASLEDLSRYWDDRKDNYYTVHDTDKSREQTPAPQKDSDGDHDMSDAQSTGFKEVYKGYRLGNSAQTPPSTLIQTVKNLTKMATPKFQCRDMDIGHFERLKIKDVTFGPVVMHNFHIVRLPKDTALAKARKVEGPLISAYARHEVIWDLEEREKEMEKRGLKKGELSEVGEVCGEKFDLLREVGGLLMLALQRAREGKGKKEDFWKQETREWWWANKQRFGGAELPWGKLSSEQYEDEDPSWSPKERELQMEKREREEKEGEKMAAFKSENLSIGDLMADGVGGGVSDMKDKRPAKKRSVVPERLPERGRGAGKGKKESEPKVEYRDGRRLVYTPPVKKKWYQEWKEVKPNKSSWDNNMIYKAIGKEEGGFDDVYQIGAVNHHVCLTKMRVSRRYLRWIETGEVEKQETGEEDLLRMRRSKWYDVFDVEQRKEFLVGLWRVMCWLHRNEVSEREFAAMTEAREAMQA